MPQPANPLSVVDYGFGLDQVHSSFAAPFAERSLVGFNRSLIGDDVVVRRDNSRRQFVERTQIDIPPNLLPSPKCALRARRILAAADDAWAVLATPEFG
jgi:hypothetical protein